jgi:hypothetical protein
MPEELSTGRPATFAHEEATSRTVEGGHRAHRVRHISLWAESLRLRADHGQAVPPRSQERREVDEAQAGLRRLKDIAFDQFAFWNISLNTESKRL